MKTLYIALIFLTQVSYGQNLLNKLEIHEEKFIVRIKKVDEFIERFNNDKESLLFKYLESKNYKIPSHNEIIKSLFNNDKKSWDLELLKMFIDDVESNNHKINLLGEFYCELKCTLEDKNGNFSANIILKFEYEKFLNAYKWTIISFISETQSNLSHCEWMPMSYDTIRTPHLSLNPVMHANDFQGFKKYLANKSALRYYANSKATKEVGCFLNLLKDSKLELCTINSISYHCLDIKNWIFRIDYLSNRGWLINELYSADIKGKNIYKEQTLKLNF